MKSAVEGGLEIRQNGHVLADRKSSLSYMQSDLMARAEAKLNNLVQPMSKSNPKDPYHLKCSRSSDQRSLVFPTSANSMQTNLNTTQARTDKRILQQH